MNLMNTQRPTTPTPSLKGRGNNGLALILFFGISAHCAALEFKETRPVAVLLGELESDDFETREKAESELKKAGADALPALTAALEKSVSLELKTRLERIIPQLKLEAETDPDKLMALCAEAAGKAQFAIAAKGYALVELRCKELSRKTKSTSEFADLRVKETDAARRMALMATLERSDRRLGQAVAAIYSELKTKPQDNKDPELRLYDVSDVAPIAITAGFENVLRAIVDVESSGNPTQGVQEQTGKFIIMTVPETHDLIKKLLAEIRVRMKTE